MPKKDGIAPISPKTAIPIATVIDCMDSIESPVLAYLYIKLNTNQAKPIPAFTIKGFVSAINVVASSGIAKDETKEPNKRANGIINLLFLNIVPIIPIVMAAIKGTINSTEVKTVKKSLLSYMV